MNCDRIYTLAIDSGAGAFESNIQTTFQFRPDFILLNQDIWSVQLEVDGKNFAEFSACPGGVWVPLPARIPVTRTLKISGSCGTTLTNLIIALKGKGE
jgi:hypothetical protein